jgi:hypothetical protein
MKRFSIVVAILICGITPFFLFMNLLELVDTTRNLSVVGQRSRSIGNLELLDRQLRKLNARYILSNGFVVPMDYYIFMRMSQLARREDSTIPGNNIINAKYQYYRSPIDIGKNRIYSIVSCRYDDCKLEKRMISIGKVPLVGNSSFLDISNIECVKRKEVDVFSIYVCRV